MNHSKESVGRRYNDLRYVEVYIGVWVGHGKKSAKREKFSDCEILITINPIHQYSY
jgi:hypothetical protein